VAGTEVIVILRLMALSFLLVPAFARAHGLDPAALSLRELRAGVFEVRWRASALRLPGANVQPALPARCRQIGPADAADEGDRIALRWTVECGPGGLAGEVIGVDDLAAAKINALLTVERLDGEEMQAVLGPRSPSFTVPARPSRWGVVGGYVTLGVEHILGGPDHLLFVFGLLLLVSASRLLVQTITAFTLGHSLTLSAAALGLASVPSRPVEVLIALSVLALALELARDGRRPTLLRRFPWAMAVAFGLLHGFGFAGALAEAGLPAGDIPLALVSFNGGIELGQLAFVAVVLTGGALLRRRLPARSTRVAVYAMGILSAFWCFERVAAWLA
jgi:hydrogenase/urease accessory protein HupE